MTVILTHVRSGHSPGLKADIPRRPSPWHEIAHSLSETALPTRRCSTSSHALPMGVTAEPRNTPPLSMTTQPTPLHSDPIAPIDADSSPNLSSSALREWDRLLSSSSDVKRHQLVHPSSSPHLRHANSTSSLGSRHAQHHSPGPPKLAAERDKDGHIEYKLKLIDPTPERFDKLVTQMLWRLKQGRNEAIYELGLADDGTVVGLTRLEMDASLRTLELMASEVGATVIVLREVVLVGGPSYPSHRFTPALSPSISSSAPSASDLSVSSDAPITGQVDKVWAWPVTRPDLDKEGLPRVSTMGGKMWRGRARRERRAVERERQRAAWRAGQPGCEKPSDSDADVDVPPFHLDLDDEPKSPVAPPIPHVNSTPSWRAWQHERKGRRRKGQHIHPEAQLDEGDPMAALPFSHFLPHGAGRQVQGQGQGEPTSKKQSAKAVKAAARREQRRLDLYRGDGTGELWLNMENAGVGADQQLADEGSHGMGQDKPSGPEVNGEGPTLSIPRAKDGGGPMNSTGGNGADHITNGTGTPPACVPMLHPYQPARPSSLRLTTPAPSSTRPPSMSDPGALDQVDEEVADPANDPFLAELLLLPLDNLSLSFAEVRTVTDPYAAYSDDDHSHDGSEGEDHGEETTTYAPSPTLSVADGASPLGAADVGTGMGTGTGQGVNGPEMICVEALVVRKTAEGVAGVEDWCEGGEDAWGFGYGYGDGDGDGDGDVEADVEAEEREGTVLKQQQQDKVDDDDPWGF